MSLYSMKEEEASRRRGLVGLEAPICAARAIFLHLAGGEVA
jgi:hypothetical protein